jgi:hypothetical protein
MRRLPVQLSSMMLSIAVLSSCSGGGGSVPAAVTVPSAPPANAGSISNSSNGTVANPATTSNPADVQSLASALASSQRPDGAIPYTSTSINPYFANIAATGAARTGLDGANVRQWIAWYITRSHDANPWGIPGAITDYTIAKNGTLQTTGSADSLDSYAATFLTLVATAWKFGDATGRSYVQSIESDVNRIASVIDAVTDTDGLTWALPTYHMKYVMDASEVYAGLNDLATLRGSAYGDAAGALAASQHAATIRAAILNSYWSDARGNFAVAIDANGVLTLPAPGVWADAMTQLAPILHGVLAPSSSTAAGIYSRFNAAFPSWTSLVKSDEYPWASVAFVALMMNDSTRAVAYRSAVDARYLPNFAYPWYCAETGWYLRVLDGIIAPQTVASD